MRRLLTLGVILISSFSVGSEDYSDAVCKKRTKISVQVGDGDSFSFKTQAGREYKTKYKPRSICIVEYKKSSSCPSMRFSCSKFSLKARNPSCTKGDKMLVVMDGKAQRFCQGNPPNVTTSGDMKIVFISNRASQSSGAECSVECVSGQDGTPGNTDVKLYHQFCSGLSSLLGHLISLLTPEQAGMVRHPDHCLNCPKPKYCWHGQCVGEDTRKLPSGDHSAYIDSITQMTKYQSSLKQSACFEVRIDCYGVCLDKILPAIASCFKDHWWQILSCVRGIIGAAEECLPCVCQLIKEHWHWWPCPEVSKPTVPGNQCDRPCSPKSPLKCVFNFTLEMLKTDTDGRRADGRLRSVLAYNGQIPGPPIVICEGDELVVNFKNGISGNMTNVDGSSNVTTLHFHGIREKTRPWSDGVPFVSQCPITPEGQTHPNNHNPFPFTYGFNTDVDGAPAGTYWYHSHVGAQRTNGAYGALIIKEKGTEEYIIDDANNTLVLQEWYESSTNQVPVSILINGHGRIGELINTGDDEKITAHLTGKGTCFDLTKNKYFDPYHFTTNYTEFHVKQPGYQYRFRVIGAISQNLPLRLSIENHTFTAIAMDSLNIQPVTNLTDLWLAAGERYDILVNTTKDQDQSGLAYKIKVLGYTDQTDNNCRLCTIAWLKYPKQSIDYTYVTDSACTGFVLPPSLRTLNPVPGYTAWKKRIKYPAWKDPNTPGNIFIADLRAIKPTDTTNLANPPHYIEFDGNKTFNGLRMTYPRVPFLLQNPANETDRCGSECNRHPPFTKCTTKTPANCKYGCKCQHVLKEPLAKKYWVELVLINNQQGVAAHPIHQHGGWYWVVGEGQYNYPNNGINSTYIMHQDQNCTAKKNCLPRNFDYPPAKDTIQVPPGGYVIIRTPLDNAGTWIFHCHINYHVIIGMAMVLQIGEQQDWCTWPLKKNVNVPCETPPPPPGGDPTTIYWFYGMEHAERCVTPGSKVTFNWDNKDHNVNNLTEANYTSCNVNNPTPDVGDSIWTAPTTMETYYFACGRYYNSKTGIGGHCKYGGMKAKIYVRSVCPH